MKKFLFSAAVVLFVTLAVSAKEVKGIHPYEVTKPVSPKLQNVSLYIEGGFNVFDGDFTSEQKHSVSAPTAGIGVMYNFNSTWGLGAEYKYRNYGVISNGVRTTNEQQKLVDGDLLRGQMHQANVFATFDIFNCWRPLNKKKLFALDLILGGGPAWYKRSLYYHASDRNGEKKEQGIAVASRKPDPADEKYTATAAFMGGASFEFNVSRSIALGLRCVYNFYTTDEVDGRTCGANNDGIFDCDLLLRWKLGAQKQSHVRNMASVAVLNDMIASQRKSKKAQATEAVAVAAVPQIIGKDTLVVMHKDTVLMKQESTIVLAQQQYYYVYFANDVYELDAQALATIQQVADLLRRDSTICLEIVGYCDNTGTSEHNNTLGFSRAKRVQEEFLLEYGVPAENTYIEGRGIIQGLRSTAAYSPNRRVEIRLVQKSEFKHEHPDALKAAVDNVNKKIGRIVTVTDHVTLSVLAREYYDNTYCWVYIYEANKDTMTNPSNTRPGMTLFIPEITEEEKAITKEAAEKRYKSRK